MNTSAINGLNGRMHFRFENGSNFNFQIGQTYSATITDVSNGRIAMMLEGGSELSLKGSIDRHIGDKISFSVKDNGSGGIVLQLIGDIGGAGSTSGSLDPLQTKDLFKQSGMISEENVLEIKQLWEEDEGAEKARLAISRIQGRIAYAADNLTAAVINELLASGISIQNLNLNMLNSVLKEVKASPEAISEEEMDSIIAKKMQELGLDKQGLENKSEIIKTLSEAALPVTENNIEFIEKSLNIYTKAGELSDAGIAHLIKSESGGSLANYYTALLTGLAKNENADMELLYKQLDAILTAQDVELTDANRKNAVFLYEHDLPITKENLEKAVYLRGLGGEEGIKNVIEKAAQGIKEGIKPEEIIIADYVSKDKLTAAYKDIIEFLPTVTDKDVAYITERNIPVTLFNLRNAQIPEGFTPKDQAGLSRHMLIQMQHKLTHEVVHRLISKGINIDIMPINRALSEISKIENDVFTEALNDAALNKTPGGISKMSEIFSSLGFLKALAVPTYNNIAEGKTPFSIDDIAKENRKNEMLLEYEKNIAKPAAAYGDTSEKVADSLSKILADMGFDPTDEALRQGEILIKSGLDINYENMLKVKIIDMKVAKLQENLTPAIAADMIKNGFDPLGSHVDRVLDYLDEYSASHGDSPKGSIAEAIYRLDQSGELSGEERESLIAMYRLFNKLEKGSMTAIGFNLKAGKMPTLMNLMDMADSAYGGIDSTVSNEGYSAALPTETKEALNRLSAAGLSTEDELAGLLIKSLEDNINIDNLNKLVANPELFELSIDELIEILSEKSDTKREISAEEGLKAFEDIKTVLSQKEEMFAFLENIGLPATIANMKTYLELSKPGYFVNTIQNIAEEIEENSEEFLVDKDKLTAGDETQPEASLSQAADKLEEKVLDKGKGTLLREVRLLQNAVKVQNALSKRTNNFKIPVSIAGDMAELNIFMPKGYIPGGEVNIAVNIAMPKGSIMAACVLEGAEVAISAAYENIGTATAKDYNSLLLGTLAEFGLKGKIADISGEAGVQESLEALPSLSKDHKELVFNLGKAIMKFADSIYSEQLQQ
ncbi:MAG: DUF6240 domain-containing protein [Defluviitaleaceae bacterium]|nr:DUF6240 domain-containing protein [Defluviitaleaceae bacterium]